MDGILQRYRATLADNVFSRQEKQAILQAIRDRCADKQQLARLRSQIFDLAREHATPQNLGVILRLAGDCQQNVAGGDVCEGI